MSNIVYPNGSIYLSGGMQHAKELGSGWRRELSPKLKQLGYYPVDIAYLDIEYTKKHSELYELKSTDNLFQFKANLRKHFIETDINLIHRDCDAVIVYYDESVRLGAGTTSEVHDAFMHDVPVFLVNGYDDIKEIPGWMIAETTDIFGNFDQLLGYLKNIPPGILRRDQYGNHRSGNHYLCSLCGVVETKNKTHYVSKVSPLYCKQCVEVVKNTVEKRANRYEFFKKIIEWEKGEQ